MADAVRTFHLSKSNMKEWKPNSAKRCVAITSQPQFQNILDDFYLKLVNQVGYIKLVILN